VILPNLIVPSRINQTLSEYGLDTLKESIDKQHFKSYPYTVNYQYNSRGFRDAEWPDNLKDAVWCIGDSFTTGMGNSFEHIWPQVLQHRTQRRTINVSLDGASNNWIAESAASIIQEVGPKNIVIFWTFFHRRQVGDSLTSAEDRQVREFQTTYAEDFENSYSLITGLDCQNTNVIHAMIPHAFFFADISIKKLWNNVRGPHWPLIIPKSLDMLPTDILSELKGQLGCYNELDIMLRYKSCSTDIHNCLGEITQKDFARDGLHIGKQTNEQFVDLIIPLLQ
jgi:hypothetical protein